MSRTVHGEGRAAAWLASALLLLSLQSFAQPAAVPAPVELRFDIERYVVEGNTLLPAAEVERLTSQFAGKRRDFGDVQRALEALDDAYRSRGYAAVQVYLPEQDLDKGQVVLRVIEGRIGKVQITSNRHFDDANIRASLPSVREGTVPNANDIAANLRVVNENPAKQTNVILRATEQPGAIGARIDVVDEKPQKWFVTLDNTGTKPTGHLRAGVGYQHANVGNLDHQLALQYVTSEKPDRVSIASAGYHAPLYAQGASIDLIAGYSDVDAGTTTTTAGELQFSGQGTVLGARFNKHLPRIAGYDHRLVLGADYRSYQNVCNLAQFGPESCGPAGASFDLHPVSATYAGLWTIERGQVGLHATASANIPGGADGKAGDLAAARPGTDPSYLVYRFGASVAKAFAGDWQARAALVAQYTDVPLVPPEQFGVGGQNSVRGYQEREISGDRGHSAIAELYTPDLAGAKDWSARLVGFYDTGRVYRVNAAPGDTVKQGVAAAGIGLRSSRGRNVAFRTDVAHTLKAGGARRKGTTRLLFGLVLAF